MDKNEDSERLAHDIFAAIELFQSQAVKDRQAVMDNWEVLIEAVGLLSQLLHPEKRQAA